jgi:2-keto-4-pentenoate hydratase/2-oxohepta-3-ene-1,7-dioic acid hydratase in catechol pathway
VAVGITTRSPWHINAHLVTEDFLVPTEVKFIAPPGITVRGAVYPQGIEKKLEFSDKPLRLYEGTVYVGAMIDVAKDAPTDTLSIRAVVMYQACDNQKCLLPDSQEVFIPVPVSTPQTAVDLAHPDIFDAIDFASLAKPSPADSSAAALGAGKNEGGGASGGLAGAIAKRGLWFGFVLVFLGGLALNLTPCVYPMIPITVSYFGGQTRGRSRQTVSLALLYLLGMATMYSALGLIAAFTGSLFGSALQNKFVLIAIALVMIGLAMSMFGYYEIRIPEKLAGVAGTAKQGPHGLVPDGAHGGHRGGAVHRPFVLEAFSPSWVNRAALSSASRSSLCSHWGSSSLCRARHGIRQYYAASEIGRMDGMDRRLFGVCCWPCGGVLPLLRDRRARVLPPFSARSVIGGVMLGFVTRVRTIAVVRRIPAFCRRGGAAVRHLYMALAPGHILRRTHVAATAWVPYARSALRAPRRTGAPWSSISPPTGACRARARAQDRSVGLGDQRDENVVTMKADLTQHGNARRTRAAPSAMIFAACPPSCSLMQKAKSAPTCARCSSSARTSSCAADRGGPFMKLVSFGPAGEEKPGVVDGNEVVDLRAISSDFPATVRDILALGLLDEVKRALPGTSPTARHRLSAVRLGPAITNPSKIICLGLNYADHAAEQGKTAPDYPMMFAKGPNSLAGDGDVTPYPPGVEQYDYEVELAFVIGKRARRVAQGDAYAHVAGYAVFMDLSARDLQAKEKQWFRAKSADGSGPLGPWLTTRDEVPDPHALDISLTLNGATMQDSRTDRMSYTVDFLVHHISQTATLEPGDVIATGTPAGVGMYRNPPVFLNRGDKLVATIERLGSLSCTIG